MGSIATNEPDRSRQMKDISDPREANCPHQVEIHSRVANRFPQRKGLVMSIHGMGGNAGDAVAPLVVGASRAQPIR